VVATSTIYTVIASEGDSREERRWEGKTSKKPIPNIKETKMKELRGNLIDEYLDTFPSIKEYVESDNTHEEFPVMDKLIFSRFDPEVLQKIDLLHLSKMEKLEFLRELIYFDPEERENLIENMLMNRDKDVGEVNYIPPLNPIALTEKFRVHVISLIEPGEKMKVMIIESLEILRELKEKIALLFGYNSEDFLLSTGGIILDEDLKLCEYEIVDDDEIVLIPRRKK